MSRYMRKYYAQLLCQYYLVYAHLGSIPNRNFFSNETSCGKARAKVSFYPAIVCVMSFSNEKNVHSRSLVIVTINLSWPINFWPRLLDFFFYVKPKNLRLCVIESVFEKWRESYWKFRPINFSSLYILYISIRSFYFYGTLYFDCFWNWRKIEA